MASFCYRIRSTQKNKLVKIQILFTVGRGNQFYVDSQYMVLTDAWDNKRQTVKSRFTFTDDFTEQQGRELTKNLSELRSHILGEIAKDPEHAMTKTRLEKIIYLADYIEPTRDFPGVDELRKTVYADLDKGLLMGLTMTIQEMEEMGNPVHHLTRDARDYLLKRGIR